MADTIARTAGIDISKVRLDVHLLPAGIECQFTNDAKGLRALPRWLPPLAPERIVYEATGAYHRLMERQLIKAALPLVKLNPQHLRAFARATGRLSKTDRFPTASDPPGVMHTGATAEVLPDLQSRPVVGGGDRFIRIAQQGASELTTFGSQVSPLVGREDVLEALIQSARACATNQQPTLVTILGAHGFGRTHLASVAAYERARVSSRVRG